MLLIHLLNVSVSVCVCMVSAPVHFKVNHTYWEITNRIDKFHASSQYDLWRMFACSDSILWCTEDEAITDERMRINTILQ